jgi:hypothetical protein
LKGAAAPAPTNRSWRAAARAAALSTGATGASRAPRWRLLAKTEKVHAFAPDGWTFRLDDWGDYKHDASAFRPIRLDSPWREQGFTEPDRIGWYRIEHRVPEALRKRELYLHVPRARGSAWLGVNGWATAWRHIGFDSERNDGPFTLHNLPAHIIEEGRMTIVLKVETHDAGAGILAPVHLPAGPAR